MAVCGGQPGVASAEAEPDGEDRFGALLAQPREGGADVVADALGRRLVDVLTEWEVVVALGDPRRTAEVVDRDRVEAALREAQRELLVEGVQPAYVGQDHDADPRRRFRLGRERHERRAVGGAQRQGLVRYRGARDRRHRGPGIEVEAHAGDPSAAR